MKYFSLSVVSVCAVTKNISTCFPVLNFDMFCLYAREQSSSFGPVRPASFTFKNHLENLPDSSTGAKELPISRKLPR